jgi:hypothetical protein
MSDPRASRPGWYRTRQQSRGIAAIALIFLAILGGSVVQALAGRRHHGRAGAKVAGLVVFAVMAAGAAIGGVRAARAGVLVDSDGITVRNPLRSVRLSWDEIDRFSVGPSLWGSVGFVHLRDGGEVHIWGIQGQSRALFPNSRWATDPVDELNRLLPENRQKTPG